LKKLGKYEVLGELGRGAMGVVYRARDPMINRLVALKTITTGVADDAALLQRFYREAQSAGGLQHPNIVTIYDMGEAGETPYIAMELVEGENLEQLISRRAVLPITLKLVYAMQACRAFDYAHKRGIVHRDIKPGNVMIGKDGSVKVVDFGIARVLEASRTQTGLLIGTFAYMSPEQYHGEHADERSDIWSFGVLLYELLSYQRPFTGSSPASLMHNICEEDPKPLTEIVSECPAELDLILTRVLQKAPSERYQSMEDLLLELDPVCKKFQAQFVAELVEQSCQLVDQEQFANARDLLRQALQIEAGNQQARTLLEKVNIELKRIQNRPKAEQFIERGRELLHQGKIEEARASAESALQLDSTLEAAQDLQRVVDAELERAQARDESLEAARQRLAEGLPEEAEAHLAKVLEADPGNAQALDLQQQVGAEKEERKKRARLLESLRHARELWTQQNYIVCIELLVDLEKEFPAEEEVSRLLESAREDQIEQQKQQGFLESRNLLASGRYEECLALLTRLEKQFPRDEDIPRLLEDARKEQINRRRLQGLAEARSTIASGQFETAITLLATLCQEFPEENEIPNLLEIARQNQKEQRRQRGLAEARERLGARAYEKCIQLLVALEKDFPRDEEILRLQDAVREERAEQRKQEGLGEARNLLAAHRYDECAVLLSALQQDFPGDDEIPKLRQAVREERTEQQKELRLREVRSLLAAKDYAKSLTLLASLETEFPAEDEIQKLLGTARKEQAEQHKREGLAHARNLLALKHYDESITALAKLQVDFSADSEIRKLLQSAQEEKAEQHKQAGLREARSLLAAGRYDESIAVLEKLQADFPAETEIRKQLATACQDLAEHKKQQTLSEARNRLAAQSFDEALTLLDPLMQTYPKDTAVVKLHTLVQREQEKYARAARIQRELDALKKLMADKQYPEVLSRTKILLNEFPGESNFVRLAEFAATQQAAIEKERLLRTTLEEARALFAANRFEEAARRAQEGLRKFPENAELSHLSQEARSQQRKFEIRQQIEARIREIRVKINREKFSDAIDLAKETLVTLGPDTDLTQLLNSAQVELETREKKRKQEQTIGSIRALIESNKLDEANQAIAEAVRSNAVETFDPRIQRLSEQLKEAQSVAEQKSAPTRVPAPPPSLSREYAFLQALPLPSRPPSPEKSLPAETSPQASAIQPTISSQPVIPSQRIPPVLPSEIPVALPETREPAPQPEAAPPVKEPSLRVEIPALRTEVSKSPRVVAPAVIMPSTDLAPLREVPFWRKPAFLGVLTLGVLAAISAAVYSIRSKAPQVTAPALKTKTEQPAPKIDPLTMQQQDALDAANKMIAANDLDGAQEKLRQAAELNGSLTSEIQKKLTDIDESLKDSHLRQIRQSEEKLWQHATSRMAGNRLTDAQKDLRQVLALPAGGVHREEAQNYLDKVIPQRARQNGLLNQSRQALRQGDFQAARQAASQLKQTGGDSAQVIADIDQEERIRLGQLENQFNQLKQQNDEAAIQQLKALQPKFQALAADSGSQAGEAQTYVNAIPTAIADAQASLQKKNADTAFQQMAQRYQQAATANDKNGLMAARTDFQSVIQNGGTHAEEARRYRSEADSKLALLNQPSAVSPKPPAKVEVPPPVTENNDAEVRIAIQRYAQAFNQKDADALRTVWPDMGAKYAQYKKTFDSASSIQEQVMVDGIDISPDGSTATVKGQVSQLYTPKGEKTKLPIHTAAVFHLTKKNGAWFITDVQ
jgi:eukaryotic-like serine/threonine-protein kinase